MAKCYPMTIVLLVCISCSIALVSVSLAEDFWGEVEILLPTTYTLEVHHGLFKRCFCEPSCACTNIEDAPAYLMAVIAGVSIGLLFNILSLGTLLAWILEIAPQTATKAITWLTYFFTTFAGCWLLIAHILFAFKDPEYSEDFYPKPHKYKVGWAWGMAVAGQIVSMIPVLSLCLFRKYYQREGG